MTTNTTFARNVRLGRLYRYQHERLLIVPMDHSVTNGPVNGRLGVSQLLARLAGNGVDAVVLHKGSLRHIDHRWFRDLSLIVHLSASTMLATDPDAKYIVTTVEESLRLGADAVSVHVNLGSRDEPRQIADLGAVAEACDRWNIPLLAMIYPRGPRIANSYEPALVAHAASLAADLGADIVKTNYVGSVSAMTDIVNTVPIPIVIAGGKLRETRDELIDYVSDVMSTGAGGMAIGRNIFQANDPGPLSREISNLIHVDTHRPVDATLAHLPTAVR